MAGKILEAISRKKTLDPNESSPLSRILTLKDLIILGLGGAMGLGAYVVPGQVAKTVAGPAVCLSFLIAALVAAIGGLCYAELAARVPKAGFAYMYTYVSVGEGIAFLIGWNLILALVLSLAASARGLAAYIDILTDNELKNTLTDLFPFNVPFVAKYPDFLSCGIVIVGTALYCSGLRESVISQSLFASVNILTILITVIVAATKINFHNWNIKLEEIEPEYRHTAGQGGFFPFGVSGVVAGITRCFYGFSGFELPANCGEEAKNPRKDIPLSIILNAAIICAMYLAISVVLTLGLPYYLQDEEAPFVNFFQQTNLSAIKWIVTVGTISALFAVFLSSFYPVPRVTYAMANDGLLFRCFAYVHPKTKTPLFGTLFTGVLSCVVATLINLDDLLDLFSFSALLCYIIISASVITLRYQCGTELTESNVPKIKNNISSFLNFECLKQPTLRSSNIAKSAITLFSFLSFLLFALITQWPQWTQSSISLIVVFVAIFMIMVCLLIIISRQPEKKENLHFRVPLVPYVPCLCVLINSYLLCQLSYQTWVISICWMAIGCVMYFSYGVRHSREIKKNQIPKAPTVENIQL